ncbi:MAG: hypothetical protein HC938_17835, partial [Nitrospira sp.]|nr:hypothetical protein [Nitrospira sp.]
TRISTHFAVERSTGTTAAQFRRNGKDDNDDGGIVDELYGKTPEQLYDMGAALFAQKDYEACADIFEISCQRSGYKLSPSCANAVYCRNMILDWGFNGTQFDRDMQRTVQIVQREVSSLSRQFNNSNKYNYQCQQ